MQITVQLFAGARQLAGRERIAVEVPPAATSRQVLDAVGRQIPALQPLAATSRLAVEGRYAADDAPVPRDA